MLEANAICDGTALAPPLGLRAIWHVDADASYDVDRGTPIRAGDGLIIRTLAGRGLIHRDDGSTVSTGPGTVLLLDQGRLCRYRCPGERWHFWWFDCPGGVGIDWLHLDLPCSPQELADHHQALLALRSPRAERRRRACALVAAWLARWLDAQADTAAPLHAAGIDAAVEAMHEYPDGSLTVADLARQAGLGERRFRSCFRERCGMAPKHYYLAVRLDLARERIRQQGQTVAATAASLGFSSAFHLSRAYHQRFGHPPSRDRGRV